MLIFFIIHKSNGPSFRTEFLDESGYIRMCFCSVVTSLAQYERVYNWNATEIHLGALS